MTRKTSSSSTKKRDEGGICGKTIMTPPELDPGTVQVIWRDLCFLALGCIVLTICGFVESHANEPEARLFFLVNEMPVSSPHGIIDTGFILTEPLYEWLRDNRDWNDCFAALNSIILVIPFFYTAYITVWKGDYSLSFQIIALNLLRALCGWYTHLPADDQYLNSYYDFPDVVHCLFEECKGGDAPQVIPFVSFFSGHCATLVAVGNYMWLNGHRRGSVLMHLLNVVQCIRLLATRGHYSIDIIIGYYVATHVIIPAGRLGRYYSRGSANALYDLFPTTPQEAFETVTGIHDTRQERRMSAILRHPEVQEALKELVIHYEDPSSCSGNINTTSFQGKETITTTTTTTTARILQENASKMMQEQAVLIQEHMDYLQEQVHEQAVALQGQMNYLQEHARQRALVVMSMDPVAELSKRRGGVYEKVSQ